MKRIALIAGIARDRAESEKQQLCRECITGRLEDLHNLNVKAEMR